MPALKKETALPFLIIILSSYPKVTWKQINSTPTPKKFHSQWKA